MTVGTAVRAILALTIALTVIYVALLDPGKVFVAVVLLVVVGVPVAAVGWAVVRIARGGGDR